MWMTKLTSTFFDSFAKLSNTLMSSNNIFYIIAGGDFVVAYSMNTSYYALEWYFPLQDMVEIYHKANFTYVWGKELLEGMSCFIKTFWRVSLFND